MKAVKFLERTVVIRFFGVCLFFAPFINIAAHAYLRSLKSEVTLKILWKSLMVGTFAQNMQNVLSISSLIIGLIMITGVKKAWSFALGLIGLQIVIQTTTLMKDLKENWFWGIVFLVNLAIFFFIADQLVFKEKRDEKDSSDDVVPQKAQPVLTTRRRIFIHFTDLNMWAQLLHISNEGLLVKSMESHPIQFSDKPMVVFLRKDLQLKLQLQRMTEAECFFQFLPMSSHEIKELNQWILSKSDVKRSSLKDNINSLSFTQKVS